MKARDATSVQEWEAADRTPVFVARASDSDGRTPVWDIILETVVGVVFDLPEEKYLQRVAVHFDVKTDDPTAVETFNTIVQALLRKHLNKINSKGERHDGRTAAREVVIDILANKEDWTPYSSIFAAFAGINDQEFFEQLVRGKQRKRKKGFQRARVVLHGELASVERRSILSGWLSGSSNTQILDRWGHCAIP